MSNTNDNWYMDIESKIFTIIKGKTYSKLIEEYPNIRYTTNDENIEPVTVFPTVYIHELGATPIGNELSSGSVNGVNSTFEVRVTTNKEKTDAKTVITEISQAFSELNFIATQLPIAQSNSNMFTYTCRYRRIVGADDFNLIN